MLSLAPLFSSGVNDPGYNNYREFVQLGTRSQQGWPKFPATLMINKMKKDPHPPEFYKGLELFNREFYFECHDVWEEIWGDAKGKNKIFYQALIMSAVSLYHFGNENLVGALSCYQKALHQFRQLPDHFLRLDIRAFVESLSEFYRGTSSGEMGLNDEKLQKLRPRIVLEDDI